MKQAPKYAQLTFCASPGFEIALERLAGEKVLPKKRATRRVGLRVTAWSQQQEFLLVEGLLLLPCRRGD